MAILKWDESFSVDIEEIDEQHKKLIGMNNEFYENIKSKSSRESISELIKKVKEYTIYHFRTEEDYLELHNYADLEEHKKEHQKFIEKVKDLEYRFNSGMLVVSIEITSFLNNWLKDHIMVKDMHYAKTIDKQTRFN